MLDGGDSGRPNFLNRLGTDLVDRPPRTEVALGRDYGTGRRRGMIDCMRRWELLAGETGHMLIPDDDPQGVTDAVAEGYRKKWDCIAEGRNDAMRQMYAHLGYGEYRPMLREDGTPYPEDEHDDYRPGAS